MTMREIDHFGPAYFMPVIYDGAWNSINTTGRRIEKACFEEWKTRCYRMKG